MADLSTVLSAGLNLTAEQLAILQANADAWKQSELAKLAADIARSKEGMSMTRRGFDLLAKAIAGKELRFTRVCLGDANGLTVDEETAYEMTSLINSRFEAGITEVKFTGGGTASVQCKVENAEVEEGFRIAEAGLFALDPDTGEEILYCYKNSGIASSWMPAGDGAVLWNILLTVITVVDKAQNVTAVIDGGLVYITQTEFYEHVNSTNPHPNIPVKSDPVDVTNYIWVNGSDDKLHPMKIDALASQILGGEASTIPKLNSRLTQAEVNLINLYTQFDAEKTLGLQGNLLMIESFVDKDCCDLYACDVITAVAGVANARIDNDKNILVGSWYTITDGTRNESVQVKSIARNDDAVVAVFYQKLQNTYDLTRTQLLRTTVSIENNQATGAGDLRGTTLNFTETFSGTGGNSVRTLPLETTQSNATNFTVSGDGAFTDDGFFTLSA